jgi:hypothetical protein
LRHSGGGLSPDRTRWLNSPSRRFFLSKDILSEVFRGKFKDALKLAVQQRKISFHGDLSSLADPKQFARFLGTLYRHDWVVISNRHSADPNSADPNTC